MSLFFRFVFTLARNDYRPGKESKGVVEMCEMDVYLVDKTGVETLYFESVDKLTPVGENLVLEDIFSQQKTVKAKIRDMAFIKHRIVLVAVE